MRYRADKLVIDGRTDTHIHTGNDNTRRPKLASGKKNGRNVIIVNRGIIQTNRVTENWSRYDYDNM